MPLVLPTTGPGTFSVDFPQSFAEPYLDEIKNSELLHNPDASLRTAEDAINSIRTVGSALVYAGLVMSDVDAGEAARVTTADDVLGKLYVRYPDGAPFLRDIIEKPINEVGASSDMPIEIATYGAKTLALADELGKFGEGEIAINDDTTRQRLGKVLGNESVQSVTTEFGPINADEPEFEITAEFAGDKRIATNITALFDRKINGGTETGLQVRIDAKSHSIDLLNGELQKLKRYGGAVLLLIPETEQVLHITNNRQM